MSGTPSATSPRRPKTKTWSRFGQLGRRPSEYEIVTHDMNHTMTGPTPLEMGPDVRGNVWLREHRDAIPLQAKDWNAFRDPDQMTYRKYTTLQDQQETYVDGLMADFVAKGADTALGEPALALLAEVMTPCRYLGHGQQMLSAYVQQLAPSSYIGNCAVFQTADQLRRVQRVAYRTKQLQLAHPERGFGTAERSVWERGASWQPFRELVERLMVAYDWHQAFVGLQLVLKPLADRLTLHEFADVARSQGGDLDALIADNLYLDAERSRRWTIACTQFLIGADAGNREALLETLAQWRGLGDAVIAAGGALLAPHVGAMRGERIGDAAAIAARVRDDWTAFLDEAGLATDS